MARRDKDEMGALTDDERAALEEADAEEAGEIEAKEAEVDEAVDAAKKAITERDPETGKFVAKDKAKDGGDEFSGEPDKKAEAEAEPAKAAAEPEPEPEPETKPADWELANRPRKTVVPDWEAPEDVEAKLAEIGTKRDALAATADKLAAQFSANELAIGEANKNLYEKARALGLSEVFGLARQVAGDTATTLQQSLISTQFPAPAGGQDRDDFLRSFAASASYAGSRSGACRRP